MRRKSPNRELKNQHHPGPSIYVETADPLPPETIERIQKHRRGHGTTHLGKGTVINHDWLIQEHQATERILNRQRRNRIMGKRIAWAIFWLLIIGAVVLCARALDHTLSEVPVILNQ